MWVGDGAMPKYGSENALRFFALHPGWSSIVWHNHAIESFLADFYPLVYEVYRACKWDIVKADIIRLCAVYHYGGLYTDLDVEWYRNIEGLLKQDPKPSVFFREAATGGVTNSIFYSDPRQPCFAELLEKIQQAPTIDSTLDVLKCTGPIALTNVVEGRDDCSIRSHYYFEYLSEAPIEVFQYGHHKNVGSWL